MKAVKNRYPLTLDLGGQSVELALMSGEDRELTSSFAESLPPRDLLFLSRDIQEPKVVDAWMRQIEAGEIYSLIAKIDGEVAGTAAIVIDKLSFSAHVGELRVLVGEQARATGLGRRLIQEAFLIGVELGLEKLTARMTLDQDAAIKVFEEMGFRQEALFRDHVKDREGQKHDLMIMSQDVQGFMSQLQAYGLDEIG
jgi:L-amino acid N-acyltransferase YncA